jgi:hypothetical protein
VACALCQSETGHLYHFPANAWAGSVPITVTCYYCYLKLTKNRPQRSELVLPGHVVTHALPILNRGHQQTADDRRHATRPVASRRRARTPKDS